MKEPTGYLRRLLVESVMVVGALGWGYGCVSRPLGAGEPDPPVWYLNPKVEDSAFLYAVGKAEACNGEDEARQVAYDRALVSFNKRVCASVTTVADEKGGMRFTISAAHELKGTAVVYEERAPYRGKWWAWVLVTYPRAEAAKLEAYLDRPRKEYQAGLACLSKGDLAGGWGLDSLPPCPCCPKTRRCSASWLPIF